MERRRRPLWIIFIFMAIFFTACASAPRHRYPPSTRGAPGTQRPYEVFGKVYYPLPSADGFVEEGLASWYGPKFNGRPTACGEIYDMYDLTAAHKILPMNTYVRVLNLENGLETIVRINDRGPFVRGRIIDLSVTAAKELGMYDDGTAYVRVEALGTPTEVYENGRRVRRLVQTQDYRKGVFWIQVGAFTDKANADRLKTGLGTKYDHVDIEPYDRGDTLFYRVRVFASTNLDQAKKMAREFEWSGFPDAFVVAR